ncbi:MAG: saccharopine dehydrogenase C-terminal domain-containing protein, partial [Verrucomicrobiota bacterium]
MLMLSTKPLAVCYFQKNLASLKQTISSTLKHMKPKRKPSGATVSVAVYGSGRIGRIIAALLADSNEFQVTVIDQDEGALEKAKQITDDKVICRRGDASDSEFSESITRVHDVVIGALPYDMLPSLANSAISGGASYFDMTEDEHAATEIVALENKCSDGQFIVTQCGLAPGFTSIFGMALAKRFEQIKSLTIRVGALPIDSSINSLGYSLTWSPEGLINEYSQQCEAIEDGIKTYLPPLRYLDRSIIQGTNYECFTTSGGISRLCDRIKKEYPSIKTVNYKTIRYPGHAEIMRILLQELQLGLPKWRKTMSQILVEAIPATTEDKVIVRFEAEGLRGPLTMREVCEGEVRGPHCIAGEPWSS